MGNEGGVGMEMGRNVPDLMTWIVANPAPRLPTLLVPREEA